MSKEEIKEMAFMPNGSTPRCLYCGKAMLNYTPKDGRFKGEVQRHSWVCDCPQFPKNVILSVG